MKPIDAFFKLLDRIILTDRWRNKGPGKVVESMPSEAREALSNLKSGEIGPDKINPKDYWMMGDDWEGKRKLLEYEKSLGIQPPPRKKYDEHG